MNSVDVELEKQLKEAGEQLLHPSDSIDELLAVLDQLEKLLLKVFQSPQKSMLEALKPSIKGLIQDSLLKHSDEDVKVSVASCISEITRITAPDAPYNDYQMRDVFQLIVSSFEDIADRSSRSYNKRASILDTVSEVRSCVIMLDLECDGLIVDMFKHFLRSVRDYHFESIYPSMETIMVLILEESEEITAEMLRPLLASVKKDHKGVLPVARKLGEGVLLKSANKLKPCLMQILTSLGESLDMYTKVVASVCEGTTATFKNNDENASGLQLANESKMEKGYVDGPHQEPTIEAQSDKASPQIHKKKRTKTETASQEKIKDSAKRSKTLASKDKKSKDNSKETGKSKEDEETPRSKTTSKSKGKTPQTSRKSDTDGPTKGKPGSSNEKEPEAEKTTESTKSWPKIRKKRKLREGVLLRSANKLQPCLISNTKVKPGSSNEKEPEAEKTTESTKSSSKIRKKRKLREGVLLKFAKNLQPCLISNTKVVDSVCEDTTATFENNDENASGLQLANESKMEKGSLEGAHQADESKLKTALSDHTEQVVKEGETFTISAPSTTIDITVLQNMRPPQPAEAGRADPVSPQTAKTERPSVQVVCQSSMCGRLDQMERIQRLGFNHTQARLDYLQTLYRLAIPYDTTLPPPPTIDPLYASFLSEAGPSTRDREDQDQEQEQAD